MCARTIWQRLNHAETKIGIKYKPRQRTLLLKRNHPERPSQIVTWTGSKE
jgi:hypothetical protein